MNLDEVVKGISEMMKHTLDKSISIIYTSKVGDINIEVDKSLVENAIMNLCINASDAMPEGGQLELTLDTECLHERLQTYSGYLEEGEYAVVTVRDNGKGMNEATINRIFEPFFTTKEAGTGVGLSAVIGVIRQHNGGVIVTSQLGKGTAFQLYFPMKTGIEEKNIKEEKKREMNGYPVMNILIVDDEPILTQVLHQFLESKGCQVKSITDSRLVAHYYEDHRDEIDFVILDMLMPYLSGTEVFERLYAIDSNVKVLYLSGYTEGVEIPEEYSDNIIGFMEKPVRLNQVYEMLIKVD